MILLNLIKFSCNKDVATNKLALTNPHIDKNKWYQGYKEDYAETFNIINDYKDKKLKNLIIKDIESNKNFDFPILCEIKIILEKTGKDTEVLKLLNDIIDNINSKDEFNIIYNLYKNIYEGLN